MSWEFRWIGGRVGKEVSGKMLADELVVRLVLVK